MDRTKEEFLQSGPDLGLRIPDAIHGIANLSPEFGAADGRTKVMSLNTSGRNFVVSSNGKLDEIGRSDDVDETSSGYSSRESQCGENIVSRIKPQKSIKPIVLAKEGEISTNVKVDNGNDDNKLEENCERVRELVKNSKTDLSAVSNLDTRSRDTLFSLKQRTKTLDEIKEVGGNKQVEICRQTCSTCSCSKELGNFADSKKIYRQPLGDTQDDTLYHLTPDKTVENGHFHYHEKRDHFTPVHKKGQEFREGATQTDFIKRELFEECSNLKKLNGELEDKLKSCNDDFDLAIRRLEKQLNNAVTEISQLKTQLLSVDLKALQRSPCSRCGYCSDGEVVELRPSSSKPRGDLLVVGDIRKAKSTDNINLRANQRIVRISQPPNLLKCIFKGENPDKVKTSLLEKNKSLKDEIRNLKEEEEVVATSSMNSNHHDMPSESSYPCDFAMDKRMATEPVITLKNEKAINEDVRWKQNQFRIPRKPKKSTNVHPQFTSAAFRTIHVTKWGPQI